MNHSHSDGPLPSPESYEYGMPDKKISEARDERWAHSNMVNVRRKAMARGLVFAHDIPKDRGLEWLVPGFLAIGEITLLAGEPGQGKSTLSCLLAAAVSQPDWTSQYGVKGIRPTRSGNVLMLNLEDQASTTTLPRLQAMGAELSRLVVFSSEDKVANAGTFVEKAKNFFEGLERDFDYIRRDAKLAESPVLVVLDPIYQVVSGDYTSNAKAREALEALREFAVKNACAVLGLVHTAKNPVGMAPLRRIANPPAFREVPRHIMVLGKYAAGPTENGGTHLVVEAKSCIGDMDGGLAYKLAAPELSTDLKVACIVVTDVLKGAPDQLLREAEMPKSVKAPSKVDLAKEFLIEHLGDGKRVHAAHLVALAKEKLDISMNTLIAGKNALGVKSTKAIGGQWEWSLGTGGLDETQGKDTGAVVPDAAGDEVSGVP